MLQPFRPAEYPTVLGRPRTIEGSRNPESGTSPRKRVTHACRTAQRERDERQRSIGAAGGDAARRAGHEQVLVIVAACVAVAHAERGIAAHTTATRRMVLEAARLYTHQLAVARARELFEYRAHRRFRMRAQITRCVAVAPRESRQRIAPRVATCRIERQLTLARGQHVVVAAHTRHAALVTT